MSRRYFLRDGSEVDEGVWLVKQGDAAYAQVEKTALPSGRWVSTLWLGVESPEVSGLFETVVFDAETKTPLDRARYATEAQAREGHRTLIARWR